MEVRICVLILLIPAILDGSNGMLLHRCNVVMCVK